MIYLWPRWNEAKFLNWVKCRFLGEDCVVHKISTKICYSPLHIDSTLLPYLYLLHAHYSFYGMTEAAKINEPLTLPLLSATVFTARTRVKFRAHHPLGIFMMFLEVSSGFPYVTNYMFVNNSELMWLPLGHEGTNFTVTLLGTHTFHPWKGTTHRIMNVLRTSWTFIFKVRISKIPFLWP